MKYSAPNKINQFLYSKPILKFCEYVFNFIITVHLSPLIDILLIFLKYK